MTGSTLHLPKQDLIRYAANPEHPSPRLTYVVLHLESGCESCARWLEEYRQAAAERRSCVDETGVPQSWIRPRRITGGIGLRGGDVGDTSLVGPAGPYEIDVLVREFRTPRSLEITGHIVEGGADRPPVAELGIALVEQHADRVVTATHTDSFGEFDLSADPRGPYGLRCGEDRDAPCVLVWEGVF